MNEKAAHDSIHQDTDRTSIVVTRRVRPGCEAAYEALLNGLLEDAKRFPGFQGGQVLRPKNPDRLNYQITLHFANRKTEEHWARSQERCRWVDGMNALSDTPVFMVLSGLETWFTLPAEGHAKTAPRHKTAFVIWLAIFPMVLVLLTLLSLVPIELPRVLTVFVTTAITVPTAVYVVLPRLTRLFESWLYRRS